MSARTALKIQRMVQDNGHSAYIYGTVGKYAVAVYRHDTGWHYVHSMKEYRAQG